MNEFDKRLILQGELFKGAEKLGNARCEVLLNEIDTSSMRAKFSSFEGDLQKAMLAFDGFNGVEFIANSGDDSIKMKVDFIGIYMESSHDEIIQGRVKEYLFYTKQKEDQIKEISIHYKLMPNSLFRTESGTIMKHWGKGLLYGWNCWRKELSEKDKNEEPEWKPVELIIPSRSGKAKIHHNFQFAEEEKDGRERYVVIDVPAVNFIITDPQQTLENILPLIDAEMEIVLLALSFIQGDFVDWSYSTAVSFNGENKRIQDVDRYKVARKIEKTDIGYFRANGRNLRATLCNIISSFYNLSEKDIKVCKNSMERYIIACRKDTIDTQLIYMHSCLDVLIKNYDTSNDPFSKRLLHICNKQGIEWQDLYPELSEIEIEEKKKDFPINTLRNDMLHHGEYADNLQMVMQETNRARGLAERIIFKMLGIDHTSSGMGKKDRFY